MGRKPTLRTREERISMSVRLTGIARRDDDVFVVNPAGDFVARGEMIYIGNRKASKMRMLPGYYVGRTQVPIDSVVCLEPNLDDGIVDIVINPDYLTQGAGS
ncbi:MAG: hypothetical protein Q8P57_02780 [Candidatus Pacearchaeota archaeon]|nr:hypothetical protein [Candidatus Pacearchaeota archaeon]